VARREERILAEAIAGECEGREIVTSRLANTSIGAVGGIGGNRIRGEEGFDGKCDRAESAGRRVAHHDANVVSGGIDGEVALEDQAGFRQGLKVLGREVHIEVLALGGEEFSGHVAL